MNVSIIIPLHTPSDRFRKDFDRYLNLDYDDYEIIIVQDEGGAFRHPRARSLSTGRNGTSPAEKRDRAIAEARGRICAFIDDDAYPDKNWLKNAVAYFGDESIGAVGGPGLTPREDSYMMKAGGLCYESIFGSASNQYRFVKKKRREVDDYPAYNLLVRTSVLESIGGFDSTFYGGEDTKLCAAVVGLGKKIVYAPDVVVYHHRRPLFKQHLLQVANVGLHRGYFVKRFPQTSRRLVYFLPSLATVFFFASIGIAIVSAEYATLLGAALSLYVIAVFLDCLRRSKRIAMSFLSLLGIFSMHIAYGISFMRGLAKRELTV